MKIALVQSEITWGKPDEGLKRYERKFAVALGCDIIILPEMFAAGSVMVKKEGSETGYLIRKTALYYDKIKEKMLAWAKKQQALVMGSTVYEEDGKFYNRLIAAFPDGRCAYYNKRHCFSMAGENDYFSAGSQQLTLDYNGIKIAVFICYDLRFPVWSRNTQHYDLAVYVANWPKPRREAWKALLKARAIENQCFVAGVNCVGTDNNGLIYSGDSMLVDAKGDTITACREEKEEIATAEIDIATLCDFRQKFPVLEDRDRFEIL
ncbi:nitrilase [Odoribacter sp. OttesenSCG-928-J03]|nr:nitrilase [Odoribacter sp. OttesenSCG-928-J03]MDL2283253.1 nitrilase [Odoribacter sp. OttesenSCG-928-G04]MDL2330586.1 nitrilase [Odoribacter sp. OttesenSCG-928-A06]